MLTLLFLLYIVQIWQMSFGGSGTFEKEVVHLKLIHLGAWSMAMAAF